MLVISGCVTDVENTRWIQHIIFFFLSCNYVLVFHSKSVLDQAGNTYLTSNTCLNLVIIFFEFVKYFVNDYTFHIEYLKKGLVIPGLESTVVLLSDCGSPWRLNLLLPCKSNICVSWKISLQDRGWGHWRKQCSWQATQVKQTYIIGY